MKLDVNGFRMNVEIAGPPDGPTVLLLHSLATDLDIWDRQVAPLARHHRVVRLDMRGHGASTATEPPYSLDLLVGDVVTALDELHIERVAVVGLSIGGMLAMGLSLQHPDRLSRAVIADVRADAPRPFVEAWDGAIAATSDSGLATVIDQSLDRWFSTDFQQRQPDVVDEVRRRALATSIDGFIGCARAVQGVAYLESLDQISLPTMFITGELDPAATPDTMRAMADRVEGSRFEIIPGAAHLTPVEAPDVFTSLVTEFLDSSAAHGAAS